MNEHFVFWMGWKESPTEGDKRPLVLNRERATAESVDAAYAQVEARLRYDPRFVRMIGKRSQGAAA